MSWSATLCIAITATQSMAAPVQFDLSRLRARGLPVALADYYANGPRFSPGYHRIALKVNGMPRGHIDAYFDPDGDICMSAELLEQGGLVLPDAKAARIHPHALPVSGPALPPPSPPACYDYRAIFPGTQIALFPAQARVELIVPLRAVRPQRQPVRQFARGGSAGMLNYDIRMAQWRYGRGSRSRVRARIEAGFNAQDWIVRSRQSLSHTPWGAAVSHDAAYAQRTFHGSGTLLQVGQLTLANAVTGAAALHGIQILPDDALSRSRPRAARIDAIASSQARVEVSQAGQQLYTTVVPPGPFSIDELEVQNEVSDLIVTVTESDGSQREFVVPATSFAAGSPVGAAGLSVAVGRFSTLGGFYPAVAVSAGRNLNPSISASATALLSSGYQGAAASLFIAPRTGSDVAARLHLSRHRASGVSGAGAHVRIGARVGHTVSASLSGNYRTAGFRHHSEARTRLGRCNAMDLTARLSFAMPSYGSISLGYGQSFQAGTMVGRYMTGSVSMRLADLSVTLAAQCYSYHSRRSGMSTYMSVSMPFGRSGTRGHASLSDAGLLTGTRMHGRIRDHTDYNASIQRNHAARDVSAGLDFNHRNRFANLSGGVWHSMGASSYSAVLSGALAVHDGGLTFSPYRIADTFGIASTNGVPDVKISTRAGIVQTDSRGQAILPSLPAYATSPVQIATRTLPRSADVDNGYRTLQPARGSVQKVRFNVTTVHRMLLDITTDDGIALQRGSLILDSAGHVVATVLDEQRIFMSRATSDAALIVKLANGRRCQLVYTLSDTLDPSRTFERAPARCYTISVD
ncbi:fimbria/pilus outer membrane usher protein [Mycetohabitans sp. B5]|uniref:fimbria/pilus outer membrane usher protein n=1 Tax=Mycetohabitans TaxID=2571159 RepID=UPI001304D0D8|nr:fimbria/pilus outer membrane usher protein [Mycetohabitans sp. B5]